MSLSEVWAYQVFNIRTTTTSIRFIKHDGNMVLINQKNQYIWWNGRNFSEENGFIKIVKIK